MSEDSKELADAGSFGLKIDFHSREGIPTEKFIAMIEDVLTDVGKKVVEEHGNLFGHIKAFITTPSGTLKVNLIDLELGAESMNRITSPTVTAGEMKFMAALVGFSDHDVEEMMEVSLEALKGPLKIEIEEHEHDHDHDEH
jgi:hypothetical protein